MRAVTAQLVQNIDSPPRNAWVGTCDFLPTSDSENFCQITVPAGQAVTVQTVTFNGTAVNHKHIIITIDTSVNSQNETWNNQITSVVGDGAEPAGVDQFAASQNLTLYAVGPLDGFTVLISTDGPNYSNANPNYGLAGAIYLIGYTVNVGTPSTN